MLVIGLTGGIGSGKTAAAKYFSELGATVIDTDQLSRDLTQSHQPALQQIVEYFGPSVLLAEGKLNRTVLRKIIFENEEKRQWLENLLHPLIRAEMKRLVDEAQTPYCIVVIPLLLETKPNPLINRILVIDTPLEQQIARTKLRDNATENEINAIIDTQVSRTTRLAAANDIIENEGSLSELAEKVRKMHEFYIDLSRATTYKSV